MLPFERTHMTSYKHSIATMVLRVPFPR